MAELTIQERMDFYQRWIIVHSYIYYELNNNIVSDFIYDKRCKELVAMKEQHPDLWLNSEYYKQFGADYVGATGFTLYHDLTEKQQEIIQSIARAICRPTINRGKEQKNGSTKGKRNKR